MAAAWSGSAMRLLPLPLSFLSRRGVRKGIYLAMGDTNVSGRMGSYAPRARGLYKLRRNSVAYIRRFSPIFLYFSLFKNFIYTTIDETASLASDAFLEFFILIFLFNLLEHLQLSRCPKLNYRVQAKKTIPTMTYFIKKLFKKYRSSP